MVRVWNDVPLMVQTGHFERIVSKLGVIDIHTILRGSVVNSVIVSNNCV